MNANLRFATAEDLPRIMTLMASAERAVQWTPEMYAKRVSQGCALLANVDRHLVGATLFSTASPGEWEVENIVVDQALRRQGIARAMLRELAVRAKERGVMRIHLEVRQSNAAAIGLYMALGFVETTRRRAYYRNPEEDAILYTLAL
jgi:[ribosomal protein S18]-alanine N-acetyltransferase